MKHIVLSSHFMRKAFKIWLKDWTLNLVKEKTANLETKILNKNLKQVQVDEN